MSIVDIDFINNRCRQDAYIILVDSSQRDKKKHPLPSQYVIELNEPLKLVYGIDILDAAIPNTMYNVDKHNCLLCLMFIHPSLNHSVQNEQMLRKLCNKYFEDLHDNANFNTLYTYTHPENYVDIAYHCLLTQWVEFHYIITTNSFQLDEFDFVENLNNHNDIHFTIFISNFPATDTLAMQQLYQLFQHIDPKLVDHYVKKQLSQNKHLMFLKRHEPKQEPLFPSIYTILDLEKFPNSMMLSFFNLYIPAGNYEYNPSVTRRHVALKTCIIKKQTFVRESLQKIGFIGNIYTDNDLISLHEIELIKKYALESKFLFVFMGVKSTCSSILGYSVPTLDVQLKYRDDHLLFFSHFSIESKFYSLVSPGIVNLTTIPYMVLKCNEIEDHIYRSFPVGKQGLGVFKLAGNTNDIAHLRFDFNNFVKRPFHPLSKLSRLTLRFETPWGDLYDFKGIDHMFILSVKFYVVKPENVFTNYQLNPNYNADFLTYTIDAMQRERDEFIERQNDSLPSISHFKQETSKYDLESDLESDTNSDTDSVGLESYGSSREQSSEEISDDEFNVDLVEKYGGH